MSEQENVRIARRTFDDLNNHNVEAVQQYMANDVRVEATGAPGPLNKDQGRMYTQQFVDAFPDLHFDIRDAIAQGDKVAITWTAKGTHKAPLSSMGGSSIPATNRKVTVPGCTIYELRNDKIVRQEILWDQVNLMTQLGVKAEQLAGAKAR